MRPAALSDQAEEVSRRRAVLTGWCAERDSNPYAPFRVGGTRKDASGARNNPYKARTPWSVTRKVPCRVRRGEERALLFLLHEGPLGRSASSSSPAGRAPWPAIRRCISCNVGMRGQWDQIKAHRLYDASEDPERLREMFAKA